MCLFLSRNVFICVPAHGEGQGPPQAALPQQRQHGASLPGQQEDQAGQHQPRRPGGRETAGRAGPHLDHHSLLSGNIRSQIYNTHIQCIVQMLWDDNTTTNQTGQQKDCFLVWYLQCNFGLIRVDLNET